ncbi:hypothetical protein DdX_07526 [Ditylenchus destructor]|uniref:Uncharacterized protein n=1 Tax=Ditylenchus destructor TaxID=166010 RepID=A0AAD4N7S8_9BILA|nr:hypothetical protein DdX_07526 [Ditylenchus destructor]
MSLSERIHRPNYLQADYVRRYVPLSGRIPRIHFHSSSGSNGGYNPSPANSSHISGFGRSPGNSALLSGSTRHFARLTSRPIIRISHMEPKRFDSVETPPTPPPAATHRRTLPQLNVFEEPTRIQPAAIEPWMLPTAIGFLPSPIHPRKLSMDDDAQFFDYDQLEGQRSPFPPEEVFKEVAKLGIVATWPAIGGYYLPTRSLITP